MKVRSVYQHNARSTMRSSPPINAVIMMTQQKAWQVWQRSPRNLTVSARHLTLHLNCCVPSMGSHSSIEQWCQGRTADSTAERPLQAKPGQASCRPAQADTTPYRLITTCLLRGRPLEIIPVLRTIGLPDHMEALPRGGGIVRLWSCCRYAHGVVGLCI